MDYPEIIINGTKLTQGEAMTVHVALQSLGAAMQEPNAMGDDEHGKFMQKAYLANIDAINRLYIK